jgi:hypothetical protein
MTAAKFEPLIFSVWGLALSNVANMFIFMVLDDFSQPYAPPLPHTGQYRSVLSRSEVVNIFIEH